MTEAEPNFESSTPTQAQRIVDLIYILEGADEHDDFVLPFRATLDVLPPECGELFPSPIVGGRLEMPMYMRILDPQTDLVDRAAQTPDDTFRWADSSNEDEVEAGFFELQAQYNSYRNDRELFPFLRYNQRAELTITQHKPFRNLPVELATEVTYEIWIDENDAAFIHRKIEPRVGLTPEGQLIESERRDKWHLDLEIDEMEKGEDSMLGRMLQVSEKLEEK